MGVMGEGMRGRRGEGEKERGACAQLQQGFMA